MYLPKKTTFIKCITYFNVMLGICVNSILYFMNSFIAINLSSNSLPIIHFILMFVNSLL